MENMEQKVYTNYQDIWADYPDTQIAMLRLDVAKQTQELLLNDDETEGRTYVFYESERNTWRYPLLDKTQDWLQLLAAQDTLSYLVVEIAGEPTAAGKQNHTIPAIPCLDRLTISVNIAYHTTRAEEVFVHIDGSADLKSLFVTGKIPYRGVGIVSELGKMPALQNFSLSVVQIPDFPAALAQLNPQTLEAIHLNEPRKFRFFPAKGKKKEESPQHLPLIETFTRLKTLSFINCRITCLPFSLASFQALESLRLTGNALDIFPPDILCLPALQTLNIDKTSLTRKRLVRGSTDVQRLLENLAEVQASETDRRKLFPLLICDVASLRDEPVGELLRLAALSQHTGMKQNALILCEKKTPNPLTDAIQHIALVGKLPHMSVGEMNEHLAKKQIQVSKKITNKTQILCIGDAPTDKEWATILENTLPICFTSHLRALVQQAQDLYLTELEQASEDNLFTMLGSNDEATVRVALKMLESGGLPPLFFEYLCLWYINPYAPLRQEVRTLLERYATRAQMVALGRVIQMSMYPIARDLIASGEFDSQNIQDAAAKYKVLGWS